METGRQEKTVKLGKMLESEGRRGFTGIKTRVCAVEFSLSKLPRRNRGAAAEHIIWLHLYELGMDAKPREKRCQDMIAVDPVTKNRVPVQVGSISTEKHGYEMRVDGAPLAEFTGFYIALFEKEPADIKLYIGSGELQRLMHETPGKLTPGKALHHEDYWSLYVPADLKGFRRYLSPEKFKDAVFGRREGN